MDTRSTIIVRNYAHAFLNVFHDSLDATSIVNIERMQNYMLKHKNALIYFSLYHIPFQTKLTLLNQLGDRFDLGKPFTKLFQLLIKNNHVLLAPSIMASMSSLYKERHHMSLFDIQTSQELTKDAIAIITHFLEKKTGTTVTANIHITPSLIAGLRLQSSKFLWEHSINEQLRQLSRLIATHEYT